MQNDHNLQNPDGVGGPRALLPPGDDNDVVPGSDEVAPLAEVDGVLHPVVDVLHPVGLALLLVEERDAASEDLHLPCHLSIPGQKLDQRITNTYCPPCDGENGTVGFVLRYNVRGGPGGGEHHDGGGLALVRRQNSADRRR